MELYLLQHWVAWIYSFHFFGLLSCFQLFSKSKNRTDYFHPWHGAFDSQKFWIQWKNLPCEQIWLGHPQWATGWQYQLNQVQLQMTSQESIQLCPQHQRKELQLDNLVLLLGLINDVTKLWKTVRSMEFRMINDVILVNSMSTNVS